MNCTCLVKTLMIENARLGRAKVKHQAITRERKLSSEICILKSFVLAFSKDLDGKFNLSHT